MLLVLLPYAVLPAHRGHLGAGLLRNFSAPFLLFARLLLIRVQVEYPCPVQYAKLLPVDFPYGLDQSAARAHLPPVAIRVAEILMGAVKVERVGELGQHPHPREIFIRLVGFVTVARALGRLVVDQNSRRLLPAYLAPETGL